MDVIADTGFLDPPATWSTNPSGYFEIHGGLSLLSLTKTQG